MNQIRYSNWCLSSAVVAFLFVIAAVPSAAFNLPDTGQTTCYQGVSPWADIPCEGTGQDGEYNGSPMNFTDNQNGTVSDNNTGLMWQKYPNFPYKNWYVASGTYHATYNPLSVDLCGGFTTGGYSDWRLPTKKELVNLVDYGIFNPAINPEYFSYLTYPSSSMYYWSATTKSDSPSSAWLLKTDEGITAWTDKSTIIGAIRCVRGAYPSQPFVDNGDGTVSDKLTGLMWQKAWPGYLESWNAALSYCDDLSLGEYSDWRLPNIKELNSLSDDRTSYAAGNGTHFVGPGGPVKFYLSSTTEARSPDMFWVEDLNNGSVFPGHRTYIIGRCNARCVRNGQSDTPPQVGLHGLFIGVRHTKMNWLGVEKTYNGDKMAEMLNNAFSKLPNYSSSILLARDISEGISALEIKSAILKLKNRMKEGDSFFLYITGHGDSRIQEQDETTWTEGDEYTQLVEDIVLLNTDKGLIDDKLYSYLTALEGYKKLIFIDSCHSGGYWGNDNPYDDGDLEKLNNIGFYSSALEYTSTPFNEDGFSLWGLSLIDAFTLDSNGFLNANADKNNITTTEEIYTFIKQRTPVGFSGWKAGDLYELGFADPIDFSEEAWSPLYRESLDFNGILVAEDASFLPTAVCRDVTVLTESGLCTSAASVDAGSFDPDGDPITLTQSPAEPYELGDTTVTLTVTDSRGASSSCTAAIHVEDSTKPTIMALTNVTAVTDPGQCSASNVTLGTPVTVDNCGIANVANNAPIIFPKGLTTVTWTVTDTSGNLNTLVQTVTVVDAGKPVLIAMPNLVVGNSESLLVPVTYHTATVSDNCDLNPTVTLNPPSGSGFPIGITTVTCTATDVAGNSTTGTFTVTRAALGFVGFLSPLGGEINLGTGGSNADPLRAFKLGSTVPLKFHLSKGGAPLATGVHILQTIKYSNAVDADPPMDATPNDAATTGNQFRLTDAATGEWHFNLDTKGLSQGSWMLRATLSDGSTHSVWITIKM